VTKSKPSNDVVSITLNIAASSVTADKDFTCIVTADEQTDQKEIGKLNTYSNNHFPTIFVLSCNLYCFSNTHQ
jgi:hypothetical protein